MLNTKEAIKVLGMYTAGRFDVWMLAGSARASCRAHIMSALYGFRVSQAKSGVNALRDALYIAGNITGEYPAQREERFVEWAKRGAL